MTKTLSPFLYPGETSKVNVLSIVYMKRDLQIPTILRDHDDKNEGYAEGKVLNTRFGNFPHSTLIGLPWGTQVRASLVDTGSRGRRKKDGDSKRRREGSENVDNPSKKIKLEDQHNEILHASQGELVQGEKEAVTASSGFIHLLPPTPENWTNSLPHRTQVVYTPDYSYILHRLRARPGSRIIEAGAGSGSFTHASARAIFNGYPTTGERSLQDSLVERKTLGKVWSFEFHEERFEKLQKEISDHGLDGIVHVTHRDVCTDGFLINNEKSPVHNDSKSGTEDMQSQSELDTKATQKKSLESHISPLANSVFLDLPAPWLALPHLTRSSSSLDNESSYISALDPTTPVHICTFSPCIEQVQRTVSVMRQLGWVDISTVELSHKRLEIRRERVGLSATGAQRGLQMTPASVEEAVARLVEVEGVFKAYHEKDNDMDVCEESSAGEVPDLNVVEMHQSAKGNGSRREKILEDLIMGKGYKKGRLVHRSEGEVKTHTSYLVFAILPQEWNEADEAAARKKWPLPAESNGTESGQLAKPISRKALKKAARAARKAKKDSDSISVDLLIEKVEDAATTGIYTDKSLDSQT
ncbi:BgtA-20738 [Blumeria graminis f. sp. tritici]|uniref:tRNA (adenine(58)-N(1))-methyltransferase catalytic subunit TRM61 n=2 Tax=Blumeria graminis f. sp. tritici TaxID=62690 RepID=A0A9X9PS40_BLUGR|nr:hypothetical protein BGT96224_A20738 [Blumeria graminis f. sp. tritici 96224]VCU40644.1 BgtA-20738 [Blumeria graminis f. sp. tritici]